MYFTYILYSETLNKYYIGFTSTSVSERLKRHNSNHRGFTGKTNDWKIVFKLEFEIIQHARLLEKKIKARGAKRLLHDL